MSGAFFSTVATWPVPRWMPRAASHLERWGLAGLLLFAAFLSFYYLGDGEFYRNEGLRAIVAAEFLRSGNWLVPTLYGEPWLTKPPGMYAAIAAASWPSGVVTEWTARLPAALASLGCVLLFFDYFRRHLGLRAGLVAGAVLPLSIGWLDKCSAAEIDMLQVFWVTASILLFERSLDATDSGDVALGWTFSLLALLCVAGGLLTKWTAPAFFYATIIPLLWCRGRLRFLWSPYHLVSAVLAASVCLAWAAAVVSEVGWDPLYSTVEREALLRLSPAHHPRAYPWLESLTHPLRVFFTALPISIFALPALRRGFAASGDESGRRVLQLLHCWLWPSLLFWSLIPEHATRHSLPLFPAIAGFAALWWLRRLSLDAPSRRDTDPLSCNAAGGRGRILSATKDVDDDRSLAGLRLNRSAGGAANVLSLSRRILLLDRPVHGFFTLLALWLVAKLVFVHVITPGRLKQRDSRGKGAAIAARVPAGSTLYVFNTKDEGIMFYYGRPVRRLPEPRLLPSSSVPLYCILNDAEWRNWDWRTVDWSLPMSDAQGDPLILVRVRETQTRQANLDSRMSAPALPENVKVLSITELTNAIRGVLEECFTPVWVGAEISNLSRPNSGHVYFTLKDANSQVKAVIWRSTALRLRFSPRDGMKVIACGRLTVYPARGEYQLMIDHLVEQGVGELERKLRELKEKLFKLGYFAPERKRRLPVFPSRVALVTSPSGAAIRDMVQTLAQRWPACEVLVCPVRVQGEGAAQEVAAGIRALNRLHHAGHLRVDVMIVGRGGGSLEDLWAFNEECVAQAIFESIIPVVSAVGHEVDVTIADLVADRRALTPTEAATCVVPSRAEQAEVLADYRQRTRHLLTQRVGQYRQRLEELAARRVFAQPLERVRNGEQKLDEISSRLRRAVGQRVERSRGHLAAQTARLEALSPLNVLSRGYSLTCREVDQALVRTAEQVQPGDRLVTRVHRGRIISRVEELPSDVPLDPPSPPDMDGLSRVESHE